MLLVSAMVISDDGKVAAIEVKISSDIPFPTPRSVSNSPIHMIKPVPAVIVITIRMMAIGEVSVRIWLVQLAPNKAP